ncbi:hypothetical protein NF556_11585 [Ornithinimicrobium faecis]|uniref:Toprim domain-containing protein n=1 Tax=Ornithinimicrobium faecis TaxID=2934158 RepID=A0ABY4YNC8_9MICO|nr:hypothetical protein [Ornithinimicrobium sp. HY1793]USQ78295.1 hypothetical protein NF556_11585 [Ornithinimicrobium sp. HY1793]
MSTARTATTARERLLEALAVAGSTITNGGTAATCPAHEDHAPSLSIGQRRDRDGVLVNCHAGCTVDDVLAALGLTPPDLFDTPREPQNNGRPVVVARYPYTDEAGTMLYEKIRMHPKTFRQCREVDGRTVWKLGDVRRVLYRLPDVLAAVQAGDAVYVAEGEKDADALVAAGVCATTWTEGAWQPNNTLKWRPTYTTTLAGAHVVIVRDRDDAGRHTAATIATELQTVAASVAIVEPAEGKDAADHLAAGHAVADLVPALEDDGRNKTNVPDRTADQRRAMLGDLLADLRTWQHLPDPTHIVAALATSATRDEDGEACWLLLVAPPSSGKTEAVRVLDEAADARLDEVTSAGLLGWSKGKTVRPTGVLMRVGAHPLVTFGDLSTLLATSDRGGRDQVFGLLRRAYDGHVSRDISPPGKVADGLPERLEWSGRLTVVGCVTGAIDRYTAHADQLGARWLYVRLPGRSTAEKRHASLLARRGSLPENRARASEAAAELLAAAKTVDQLPDHLALQIEDAALVTAWGRGSVPRNGYGRREIEGVPVVEEPMRLVQQLGAVARGVLALGLPTEAAAAVARRVALDSMPESRRAVLEALATGEVLTTSGVGRAAALDRKVARFTLEDLAAIGVVAHDRAEDEDEDIQGTVHWSLTGEDGVLISDVFAAHSRYGGWDETWVYTSTSPPERETKRETSGGNPTLRPTPDHAPPAADAAADSDLRCPSCAGATTPTRDAAGLPCLACYEKRTA